MKIRLKKGKQNELIYLTKGDLTWKELAKNLNISEAYLSGDLKREKILTSERLYEELCSICGVNFDKFIINKLNNNWGQSKGGLNSSGSTIKLKLPEFCEDLAEFVGAVLGDGHVCSLKKDIETRKIGVYQIRIAGDLRLDKEYHDYLAEISRVLFGLNPGFILTEKNNERFLCLSSKELVDFFVDMGINPGNKIINQSTIPKWIYKDKNYLRACLRGLIDTDGCIHRMSKRDSHLLRINFTNHDLKLLEDTRNSFILLGFHPSKIINNQKFFISRQNEIEKYLKEIGFSNKKHRDRYKTFKSPLR